MKKRKILVTDDKPEIREFVQETLEEVGFDIVIATNGLECLKKVLEERPDMIVSDVMMPKMSGYHALQGLRQQDPIFRNIPVLIMTANKNIKELFPDWEIEGFLQKPFSSAQLLEKVEEAWDNRIRENEEEEVFELTDENGIPIESELPQEDAPAIASSQEETRAPRCVLFVAQDNFDLTFVKPQFSASGFNCIHAPGFEFGIPMAASTNPKLVLVEFGTQASLSDFSVFIDKLQATLKPNNTPFAVFAEKSHPYAKNVIEKVEHALFFDDGPELIGELKKLLKEIGLIR